MKPYLNNERIIAQSGWFTSHAYSNKSERFVNFELNLEVKDLITEIRIPSLLKKKIIENLSLFGVNNWTVYTDLVGLCSHLNWKYIDQKYEAAANSRFALLREKC